MTRFLPYTGHPCKATFAPAKVRLSQKLRDGLRLFISDSFQNLSSANDQNSCFAFSLPPLFTRGEVEGGFSKESLPSEKLSLERGKKGGGQMSEETKQEEKPKEEPMGFKVTEEEMELALKKVLAGLYW